MLRSMTEKQRLLKRLKNPPIVEAVAEFRFTSPDDSAGDLLPGILFPELADVMPRIERLPLHEIPKSIVLSDPSLSYKPKIRIVGEKSVLSVGHRVCSITFGRPYPGWSDFRQLIDRVLSILETSRVQMVIERVSVAYVNLITLQGDETPLSVLNLSVNASDLDFSSRTLQFRGEVVRGDISTIISVATHITVQHSPTKEELVGTQLVVDSILSLNSSFDRAKLIGALESVHSAEKSIFVTLLPSTVLERYGPIWE